MPTDTTPTFRIDKFIVPAEVLARFVAKMQEIQRTLRTLPGCVRTHVLTQIGGAGEFNIVTLVEWASAEAIQNAAAVMKAKFAAEGFAPAEFAKQLGVKSDLGIYAPAA
jgi:hypothetical protein